MPKALPNNRYQVQAFLKLDVGMEIEAASLEEAAAKGKALTIHDFIDFKALGLDHNDSKRPDVYSVFRLGDGLA